MGMPQYVASRCPFISPWPWVSNLLIWGEWEYISATFLDRRGWSVLSLPPPIFLYRKFIEFRYVKFEVFWPSKIMSLYEYFFLWVISKIGRRSFNFLKFKCMMISLSFSIMNTVMNNIQASQAFAVGHSCHICDTRSLFLGKTDLAIIAQDAFQSISELLLRTGAARCKDFSCWSLANLGALFPPPTLREKSTPLAMTDIKCFLYWWPRKSVGL